jgi:hypothetical protein
VRSIKEASTAVVVAAATAVKLMHYRGACSVLVVKPLVAATAVNGRVALMCILLAVASTGIGPNVSEH